jgi:hypothetical protein
MGPYALAQLKQHKGDSSVAYNKNVFLIAQDYVSVVVNSERMAAGETARTGWANLGENFLAKGDTWADEKPQWNVVAVSNNPDLLAQEKAAWQSMEANMLQENADAAAVEAGLIGALCVAGAVETVGGSCVLAAGVGFLIGLMGNQLWNDVNGTTAKLNELKAIYDKESGNTHNELYCPTGSCAEPGWTPDASGGSWYSPGTFDPYWNHP